MKIWYVTINNEITKPTYTKKIKNKNKNCNIVAYNILYNKKNTLYEHTKNV